MRRKLPNKYNGNCLTHADLEVANVLGIRIGAAPSEAVLDAGILVGRPAAQPARPLLVEG